MEDLLPNSTGVYYADKSDKKVIDKVFSQVSKGLDSPMAVESGQLKNFFRAEDYHQDYLDKNPGGYCHISASLFEFAKKAKMRK